MSSNVLFFKLAFCFGAAVYLALIGMRRSKNRRNVVVDRRESPVHSLLSMLAFMGTHVIPLVYVFTSWLDFVDYHRPAFVGWMGLLIFVGSLGLIWKAHHDLGRNWSIRMEVAEDQTLVTQGIYQYIRHPIYAGMWLWGIGQALVLSNWIAGLAALVLFVPVYFYRVPREEQMMVERFGDEYLAYTERIGRIIPRLRGLISK